MEEIEDVSPKGCTRSKEKGSGALEQKETGTHTRTLVSIY